MHRITVCQRSSHRRWLLCLWSHWIQYQWRSPMDIFVGVHDMVKIMLREADILICNFLFSFILWHNGGHHDFPRVSPTFSEWTSVIDDIDYLVWSPFTRVWATKTVWSELVFLASDLHLSWGRPLVCWIYSSRSPYLARLLRYSANSLQCSIRWP